MEAGSRRLKRRVNAMKNKAEERAKREVQPHEVVRMMVAGSRGVDVGHVVEQGEGIYLVTLDMEKEPYWNVELQYRNVWFTLPSCSFFARKRRR